MRRNTKASAGPHPLPLDPELDPDVKQGMGARVREATTHQQCPEGNRPVRPEVLTSTEAHRSSSSSIRNSG